MNASEPPAPVLIPATCHEKVWGRPRGSLRLGEIWCRAEPLLLKFIFTAEKLSVQVHPGDDYAWPHDNSAGKTECWYIMETEPGAQLAIGLRRPLTRAQVLESIRTGAIESELCWLDVRPGDFIFVPWGTVHAIGPGITLCEVQEFSDITYRIYDYGRPRELHLEKALDVIRRHPAAGVTRPAHIASAAVAHDFLIACRYFAMEKFSTEAAFVSAVDASRFEVLVFLEGEGEIIAGGLRQPYTGEQMWRLPETLGEYRVAPRRRTTWLKAYVPPSLEAVHAALREAGVPESERRRLVVEDI